MAEVDRGAGVMFPPPLVFLGVALIGPVIDRLLGLPPLPIPGWLSVIFLLPGFILIGIAIGLFRQRGENPVPSTPTAGVIDTGIYARTRNPMYLGMAIAYPGVAILLQSMPSLLLLPVAIIMINTQVIAREERYLEAKFGAAFVAYKARVRRWL
ncbi:MULTISPECIES: isoprenylcysteine carboxylmethyltransferase family protein [unclassified Sphingomonas]|uniref:methyltransferase family protein n=1 Tax=unclassified Sphingomonas TaxID=196159 RepID=UPI000BDBD09C|nr:MAG: hypothetical protein B7Y98_03270 [Sphingomonas sp. 32-62-10]